MTKRCVRCALRRSMAWFSVTVRLISIQIDGAAGVNVFDTRFAFIWRAAEWEAYKHVWDERGERGISFQVLTGIGSASVSSRCFRDSTVRRNSEHKSKHNSPVMKKMKSSKFFLIIQCHLFKIILECLPSTSKPRMYSDLFINQSINRIKKKITHLCVLLRQGLGFVSTFFLRARIL